MKTELLQVVMAALAAACGWLLRWFANQRQWASVRRVARAELESADPDTTNDPELAVSKALAKTHHKRVKSESLMLAPRAGSHSDGNGTEHKEQP